MSQLRAGSSSAPAAASFWPLGEYLTEKRVIFVFVDMMNSNVPVCIALVARKG